MDAIIFVYLITIFLVLTITSLISCNNCNKSKNTGSKGNENKTTSINKSSCESVEIFQLAANEKSTKQSHLISASIRESIASTKSDIDIDGSINSQKSKKEIHTKPTEVKDTKKTSKIQAGTSANSPAKCGSSKNTPGKDAQRSAASLIKQTSSPAHSTAVSASNKLQNPVSRIKQSQLNSKQSDMIIPQYPASPVKIRSQIENSQMSPMQSPANFYVIT